MPKACDLKRNALVLLNAVPHILESLSVSTPSARGASSIYRFRFRNLVTKAKLDQTCKGEDAFEGAHVDKSEVQFLYSQADEFAFMDLESYDQFTLQRDDLGDQVNYLIEDMEEIRVLRSDGRVLCIEVPDTVVMQVVECSPSIKGASATSRTKPATLATGLVVQVPEYLSPDEQIKVDTRTGKFLSRA